jgi:glutathione S-transferase
MITVYAFRWVPPFARKRVRDVRVRWALEEAGLPYRTQLIEVGENHGVEHRALQPFGQIPVFEEDGFVLFESGAIVLHIGERCDAILPREAKARARAVQWVVAALNSVEPPIMDFITADVFFAGEAWAKARGPGARAFAQQRIAAVGEALGDKPYLDGDRFTAGDLLMATVLTIRGDLIEQPNLEAYVARCTGRPAYQRAMAAHLADVRPDEAPAGA